MRLTTTLFLLMCATSIISAQNVPANRVTDWSQAGHVDSLPVFNNIVNIMSHGGVADGVTPNDVAFSRALASLNGNAGTIYLPAGTYLFNQNIDITIDSVIIKGDGLATKLIFDLNHAAVNLINIAGIFDLNTYVLTTQANKGASFLVIDNTADLSTNSYLFINDYNTSLIFSSWAYQSLGQMVQVKSISNDTVFLNQPLRYTYPTGANTFIKKVSPVKEVGIECLYIERRDSTTQQTDNINFNKTANCWVVGIESNLTNFSHVSINYSTHILVRGCYFHHAHSYGSGGEAYGTTLQYGSGDCLIENNIFEHLRHSMLVQAGANGNVLSYNYSFDPYWTQPPFPTNAGGDMVCHGNYPYCNLFEGNIGQSIVVDDSHGINGPYNTFFRNRAELYGIFTSSNPASDTVNYIGNEITNTGASLGFYLLNGNGHYEQANNVKTVITPANTSIKDSSLYLTGYPGYWTNKNGYPSIGEPSTYNQGSNTAKDRYTSSTKTDCARNPKFVGIKDILNNKLEVSISPNPFTNILQIDLGNNNSPTYSIYNLSGQMVLSGKLSSGENNINVAALSLGIYILELTDYTGANSRNKIVKVTD